MFSNGNKYEPYHSIIQKHLDARNNAPEGLAVYQKDETYPDSMKYVVDMCRSLHEAIKEQGGVCILEDIIRVDRLASGHVDYHSKFALYCHELEAGL